jgi:ribonucleoside-diphosphate reductase beta chain
MEGNAKIIKFIARDENVHLAFTQQLLKILPTDDSDYIKIREETRDEMIQMYESAIQQEKDWAKFLFKDGSMIGLNQQLLSEYIDWIGHKRMTAIGLPSSYKSGSNPLPWTAKWIAGSDVQVAPQETEISSYIVGGTKQDVTDTTLSGLSL